jgi:hypothetical protein
LTACERAADAAERERERAPAQRSPATPTLELTASRPTSLSNKPRESTPPAAPHRRRTLHYARSLPSHRVASLVHSNHACCSALTLFICSSRHSSAPALHRPTPTAEQAHPRASTTHSPPPAHCGAVTHWSLNTLHTPTIVVAASTCQLTLLRDLPDRP